MINDIAGSGLSKFKSIGKLIDGGLVVQDAVVLIDRELGASEALAKQGIHMHSVLTITSLLDYWEVPVKSHPNTSTPPACLCRPNKEKIHPPPTPSQNREGDFFNLV